MRYFVDASQSWVAILAPTFNMLVNLLIELGNRARGNSGTPQSFGDIDVFVFGMVLVKQSPGSARSMVFVTLEDEAGFFNLAFTPQGYTRFYRAVDQQPFLCVVGQLQQINESHSVLVKRVFDIDRHASLFSMDPTVADQPDETVVELVKPRTFH